jgi:methylthioribose-1-phosphate isomerase
VSDTERTDRDAPAAEPATPSTPPSDATPIETTPAGGADLARRRFFRQFAGDVVHGAATVVGAAQALQRASAEAATVILDPGAYAATPPPRPAVPAPPTGFRTPFREDDGILYIVDQRKLPDALEEFAAKSAAQVGYAIREMIVRGAPAIGQVAAIGMALTAQANASTRPYARRATLRGAANVLRNSRPTAVNLGWAVDRVMAAYEAVGDLSEDGDAIAAAIRAEADAIVFEATEDHGRLAVFGLDALEFPEDRPLHLLTHCNTGPLACGQFGTALGVVQAAHNAERSIHVWVDETRPYLQGARLTAWELAQAGVPHSLIPDAAAGHLMARGEVDAVIVGADRIVANGDTANKIGTYTLAVLAARHGIPFYVAAPVSSIDLGTATGDDIPIEERSPDEVLHVRGVRLAPPETAARNPAFDITPAELISGIITDEGVLRPPYETPLAEAVAARARRRATTPGLAALAGGG